MPAAPSSGSTPAGTPIPKFVTDFTWSLKPWPVTAWWYGQPHDIPALPAVDWITALVDGDRLNWLGIFPGLCGPGIRQSIDEGLVSGQVDIWDLVDVARDVLSAVSGREWWVAVRLIGAAANSWNVVGGEFAIRHVDAATLSLSGWLDAALHILLRAMDRKDHTMFLSQLEIPPVEIRDQMPEPEMSADAFLALGR